MQIAASISKESQKSVKSEYIDRIGPWAFQSFSPYKWHQVSDDDVIEGALLSAPEKEKFVLLSLYDLSHILRVWRSKVLIQDEWKHSVNVWIAENLFGQKQAEKFVKNAFREAMKQRERQFEHGRVISSR